MTDPNRPAAVAPGPAAPAPAAGAAKASPTALSPAAAKAATAPVKRAPARPPVILWRAPLDGGRWLASALLGTERTQLEPFGPAGPWRELSEGWQDPWRHDAVSKRLRQALADKPPLLHTVAPGMGAFDLGLMQVTSLLGYHHVLLHRRRGELRLAQALAEGGELQGEAAPAQVRQALATDQALTTALARVRQGLRHSVPQTQLCCALEDLAPGPHADPGLLWARLVELLGLRPPARWPAWSRRLHDEALQADAQLRASKWHRMLQTEAAWLAHLELGPAFLQPRLQTADAEASPGLRLARFGAMPALLQEGETLMLGGVVVLAGQPSDDGLVLQQADVPRPVGWGQPSPVIAQAHPEEPGAATARFKLTPVTALHRHPARLVHRRQGPAGDTAIAELAFEPQTRPPMPGILLARWSLGYLPIPKVACTSIKEALFKLATDEPFSPKAAGGATHVHSYFDRRSSDISQARRRLLVVRDPIQRFLSGYGNRVLHHQELSREYLQRQPMWERLQRENFVFDPDLEQFIDRLAQYRQVPTIDHHFRPMSEFVPPLASFDKVYPFEALHQFCEDVTHWTERPLPLGHMQRGGPKLTAADLSPAARRKLLAYYAADYDMLSGLYSPEAWQ